VFETPSNWDSSYIDAKQMVCQAYRTRYPIDMPSRTRQAPVPVEIILAALDQNGNIGEPKRPNRSVSQKMQTKEPQVILRTQNSNIDLSQLNHLRALENRIGLLLIELAEAHVQIYGCLLGIGIL